MLHVFAVVSVVRKTAILTDWSVFGVERNEKAVILSYHVVLPTHLNHMDQEEQKHFQ